MADTLSCIIAACDEAHLLRKCLQRLSFCKEIILCDMGSVDGSRDLAGEFANVTVVEHPRVPVVEQVYPFLFPLTQCQWILRMDPDEEFPEEIADDLCAFLVAHRDLGEVRLYYQYYFRGRPLRGTRWGGRRAISKVYNREATILTGNVHRGFDYKPGFRSAVFEGDGRYVVRHFWADSYAELLHKHRRYLSQEGASRYNRGERFSWPGFCYDQLRNVKNNLLRLDFLVDGCDGVFLRFFYLWYDARAAFELRRYQRARRR